MPNLSFAQAGERVIAALRTEFEGFDPDSLNLDDSGREDGDPARRGILFTHLDDSKEPPHTETAWAVPWSAALEGAGVWKGLRTEERRVRIAGVAVVDSSDPEEQIEVYFDRASVAAQLGLVVQGRQFAPEAQAR